jgi:hypothetical protein
VTVRGVLREVFDWRWPSAVLITVAVSALSAIALAALHTRNLTASAASTRITELDNRIAALQAEDRADNQAYAGRQAQTEAELGADTARLVALDQQLEALGARPVYVISESGTTTTTAPGRQSTTTSTTRPPSTTTTTTRPRRCVSLPIVGTCG